MRERSGQSWLLAIDTSTDLTGLALTNGSETAEAVWQAGREQTVTVLPAIDRLLQETGVPRADLSAIAVATGPGMFSSLRVGLSIAKGLAFGLELPVIGVDSLLATTWPWFDEPGRLIGVVHAGRGRVTWGEADRAIGAIMNVHNTTIDELAGAVAGMGLAPILVAGETEGLTELSNVTLRPGRSPQALAAIGWSRFLSGAFDDSASLDATYLHRVNEMAGSA